MRADGREPEVVWGSSIPTGVVLGTRLLAYDLNSAPVAPDGTVPAEFPVRREGDAVAALLLIKWLKPCLEKCK